MAFMHHELRQSIHICRCDESYIVVGTSSGCLLLLTEDGDLLHRQRMHATAVTAITLRAAGQHAHDSSEDATVCCEDAVARISSLEVGLPLLPV